MTGVGQGAEIHRCEQADGTVAFQETPCPEPARVSSDDKQSSKESNDDQAAPQPEVLDTVVSATESDESPALVSTERAECEKMTRDAIDAIDDEMRKNRTAEAREAYLGELLELTQQLRACKQL
jgi:hypothetical protein